MPVSLEELEQHLNSAANAAERLAAALALAERLQQADARRAQALADEAIELAASLDRPAELARAHYFSGFAHHYQGNASEALSHLQAAQRAAEQACDREWLGMARRGIGIIYDTCGLYDQALECFLEALALFQQVGLPARERMAANSIAIIYSRTERRCEAIEQFRLLADQFGVAGQIKDQACALCNLGVDLGKEGQADAALVALGQAEQLLHGHGADGLLAAIRANRASTLSVLGRAVEALCLLRDVIPELVSHGMTVSEIDARVQLGRLLIESGHYGEAEVELQMAHEMALDGQMPEFLQDAQRVLSGLYKRQRRFELALEYSERYHTSERVMFNERSDRKLKLLQARVDLENVRQQMELERLRHTELARAHEELQRASRALFEADRVKSALVLQLEQQSMTDPLTGIHNRRYLDRQLAQEFERARRYRHPLTVAVCDIDHFKHINDRFSHAVGDETIKAVAQLLRSHVRQSDIVARFGGEEFVLVFIELGLEDAAAACEKVRQTVQAHPWHHIHPDLSVTVSIGVAPGHEHFNHEKMLSAADLCLYAAKHQGRNRVCSDVPAVN
ncbi:GGDEF domain-containing protein [Chitinivorax sp. PXF-14]|uniref:diguanylate cyclase n=1 Tax=Chitinivorax sp. PXF-14 TaxID=3230488 RepID=UPI0034679020